MHACCDIIRGYRLSATTGWSGIISTILLLALQYTGRLMGTVGTLAYMQCSSSSVAVHHGMNRIYNDMIVMHVWLLYIYLLKCIVASNDDDDNYLFSALLYSRIESLV